MKSAVFSTTLEAYQVSNIIYAGPVKEIPEEHQKTHSATHEFKIITTLGPVYCKYKDQESATRARGALGAMMDTLKSNLYRTGRECLDPHKVVSFGRVVQLKNTTDGMTHAFVVSLETTQDKNNQIWFTYRSEDNAVKARKALFASIQSANNMERPTPSASEQEVKQTPDKKESNLPF